MTPTPADTSATAIASVVATDVTAAATAAATDAANARVRARGARIAAFVRSVMTVAVPSRGRPTGGPEAATAMLAGEEPSPTSRNPTTVDSGAAPRNGQSGSPVPHGIQCPGASAYGCGSAPEFDRLPPQRGVELCPRHYSGATSAVASCRDFESPSFDSAGSWCRSRCGTASSGGARSLAVGPGPAQFHRRRW